MTVLVTRECRTPEIKPLHKEKYTEFKKEQHREEEQRWLRGSCHPHLLFKSPSLLWEYNEEKVVTAV